MVGILTICGELNKVERTLSLRDAFIMRLRSYAFVLAIFAPLLSIFNTEFRVYVYSFAYGGYLLIAFLYSVYKEKVSRDQLEQELKKLKGELEVCKCEINRLQEIVPGAFIFKSIKKSVEIETKDGDANVQVTYSVKSSIRVPREIKHELTYDGPQPINQITVEVGGLTVDPTIESHYKKCDGTGKDWLTRFKIPLGLKPPFTYSYAFKLPKLYPNLTSNEPKESTQQTIRHETEELTIQVQSKIGPFVRDVKYLVCDYFGTTDEEAQRALEESGQKPEFKANDTIIVWNITRPKIGYSYQLFFRVKQS
jgi:hypothetical protein